MKSPAELLNSRKYKSTLLSKISSLHDQEETRNKLANDQKKGKQYYNKHTHSQPELFRGQHIHTQDKVMKTWSPAQIIGTAETPRLYIIVTESGKQLR